MGNAANGKSMRTIPAIISSVSLLLEEYTVTKIPEIHDNGTNYRIYK